MKKETYTHIVMAAIAVAIVGIVFASVALSQHQSKTATSVTQQNITNITLGTNTIELPANTIISNFSLIASACLPNPPFYNLRIDNLSGFKKYIIYGPAIFGPGNTSYNDYVLTPGNIGIIHYTIVMIYTPVIKQYIKVFQVIRSNINFSRINSYGSNSTIETLKQVGISAYIINAAGINLPSMKGYNRTSYNVTVIIKASSNAIQNTYAINLKPETCSFGPDFYLTIGTTPYTKSLPKIIPPI